MRNKRSAGWRRTAMTALCLAVLGAASASALDFNDVQNLLRNQVAESVIFSMVRQNTSLTLTPEQANVLRSLGASESLIAAFPPAAAVLPAYVVPEPAPAPSQTYGYDADGNIVYFDANTGQVLSTVPQTVDPGVVYYESSAPVIIESAPTVIYETPAYVYPRGPSWGFSIHLGDGDRWGGRRHGYRPHRRPPPPPYGRPGDRLPGWRPPRP